MKVPIGGRSRLAAWAAALVLGAPVAAHGLVTLSPSVALACMTPPEAERGVPEYDAELVKRKDGGTVKVELSFASAAAEPDIRFLGPPTLTGLTDGVRAHVRKLRVPCLPAGAEPARIILSFDFVPNDGRKVMAWRPVDAADAARQQSAKCLTRIVAGDTPDYPFGSVDRNDQGKFLVRLLFSSATAPPATTILDGPRDARLRAAVERFVEGYRLPCLAGEPVAFSQVYTFRIDGSERTVIKDLTLQQLLGAVRSILKPVYFDTTKMACPFDLRVTYMQPHEPNRVGQLGSANPDRQALQDWLSAMELVLKQPYRVLGDQFTVSVPCIIIDL